jgi:hypothetical protein
MSEVPDDKRQDQDFTGSIPRNIAEAHERSERTLLPTSRPGAVYCAQWMVWLLIMAKTASRSGPCRMKPLLKESGASR